MGAVDVLAAGLTAAAAAGSSPSALTGLVAPGGVLITVLGAVAYIVREVRGAREADVAKFRTQAEEAESNRQGDLAELNAKIDGLEKRIVELTDQLAAQDRRHSEDLRDRDDRHRAEMATAHNRLLDEIRIGHARAEALAREGIPDPATTSAVAERPST